MKTLFREFCSRTIAAGTFAVLALIFAPGGLSAGCCGQGDAGAFRTHRQIPCAAMLHQEPSDFALHPLAGKERPRTFAPRRPFQPEAESPCTVKPGAAPGGAEPPLRPGADYCRQILHAAFPIRAGPFLT